MGVKRCLLYDKVEVERGGFAFFALQDRSVFKVLW